MKDMTTKDYYDYKSDAMNVDMDVDGSLTKKNLNKNGKPSLIPVKLVLVLVFNYRAGLGFYKSCKVSADFAEGRGISI